MPRAVACSSETEASWAEFLSLASRSWFGDDVPEDSTVRLNASLLAQASSQDSTAAAVKTERVAKWVESASAQLAPGGYPHHEASPLRRSSAHARNSRPQQTQLRKSHKTSPCRHSSRPAADPRVASCPHKLPVATMHSHPPAAHKLPYARPLTIPEVNEEDDGGGGCNLPVVSETTGRSSSRWSSARLCELEKLLSVESDTSRTSDSVGAPPNQPAGGMAESCIVMHTPFCNDPSPKQNLELSPVPSCDYMPSGSSVSGKEVSSGVRNAWTPAALTLPPSQRKLLPHSERASPVVGSPAGGCALERSMTCYAGQQAIDMASVMEAAVHSAKLHMSSSSVEMASRCLPSVTLTTSAGPAPRRLGQMAYSRMGSCPGPVPHAFASVRCGDSAAM